jgi:hypothetical protein
MWGLWNVFAFVQVGTLRWFGEYWKYNQIIHNIIGSVTSFYTLVGGFAAFAKLKNKVHPHPHNIIGFTMVCCVIVLASTGVIAFKMKDGEWMTLKI